MTPICVFYRHSPSALQSFINANRIANTCGSLKNNSEGTSKKT